MKNMLRTFASLLILILTLSFFVNVDGAKSANDALNQSKYLNASSALLEFEEPKWFDDFADSTKINPESTSNIEQKRNSYFYTNYDPRTGDPLSSLYDGYVWNAEATPPAGQSGQYYDVQTAVHPDIVYFPNGKDGYKYWMVYTPAGELPFPPGINPIPSYVPSSMRRDYWWERMTLVRSNNGIDWEKTANYINPLIIPGEEGAWDDTWHADPDLVYAPGKGPNGESWFLYFVGGHHDLNHRMGVALSSDGLHYTKCELEDITMGPISMGRPTVVYDDDDGKFHLWYNNANLQVGYATSDDGLHFTPYSAGGWQSPVLSDKYGASHMDVVKYKDRYIMFYQANSTAGYKGLSIKAAESFDRIHWQAYGNSNHPAVVLTPNLPPSEIYNYTYPTQYEYNYEFNFAHNWLFPQRYTWDTNWPFPDPIAREDADVLSLYRTGAVVVDDKIQLYFSGTSLFDPYSPGIFDFQIGLAQGEPEGYLKLRSNEYADRPDTVAWFHLNENISTYVNKPEDTKAYYHFDEAQGSTANDSSGNSNNGTTANTSWVGGIRNSALQFGGSGNVIIPNHATLNPTDKITIEAWVKPSQNRSNNYIVTKMTPSAPQYSYGMKIENAYTGYSELGGWIYGENQNFYVAYGGQIPINEWSHVAMSYDNTTDSHIRLYINGREVAYRYGTPNNATDTIPSGTRIRASSGPLAIGKLQPLYPSNVSSYFYGAIDEFRLLSTALTPDEILADSQPGIVDASSNENNGFFYSTLPNLFVEGVYDNAASFDGDDYIAIPNHTTLNPQDAITIEAWVKPSQNRSNNYIVTKMTPSAPQYSYGMKIENAYTGYSELGGWIYGENQNFYVAYGGRIPVQEWSHVAMSYDRTTDSHIRLYINGREVAYRYGTPNNATDTIPSGTRIRASSGPLAIGKLQPLYPSNVSSYFYGAIDEFRLLSTALTPDEILSDYRGKHEFGGTVQSIQLTLPTGKVWDTFYAREQAPVGTIKYYINEVSPENEIQLGDPIPAGLNSQPIVLIAVMTPYGAYQSPILDDWGVFYKDP